MSSYLEWWVDDLKRGHVRPNTHTKYSTEIGHMIPSIGDIALSDLSAADVQTCYADLQDQGLAASTRRCIANTLRRALDDALKWKKLAVNPARVVEPPKVERVEMAFWSEDEVSLFLEANRMDRQIALWQILLKTGMRIGEAHGLQWADVDWKAPAVRIERQAVRCEGGMTLGPPKSESSRRVIDFGLDVAGVLKERQRQAISVLIFPNRDGDVSGESATWKAAKRAMERAGVPVIRVHDMRHTHASILLSRGTPINVVAARLGHSSPSITLNRYGHLMPGQQAEAAKVMDGL